MARRKRKPKSTSSGWLASRPELLRRWGPRVLIALVAATGLIVALTLTGSATVEYVNAMDRFQVRFSDVTCNRGPDWIHGTFLEEVRLSAGIEQTFSALDTDVLKRLHAGFKLHPWVRDVQWVRADYPNRITARLRYRRPVALVRVQGGWKVIDDQGVVLPTDKIPVDKLRDLLRITGVAGLAPEQAGVLWDDPAVRSGSQLASLLSPHRQHLRLTTVDMSNFKGRLDPRRSEVVLLTAYDTRIAWGRPPDTDKPGEVSAGEKIQRLLDYSAAFPNDYRHCDIDIRHWDGITQQRQTNRGLPDAYVRTVRTD